MHDTLVTHITQFYTLQMTRCDNILYLLYYTEERSRLQLKSVSSPIEMKTLSEMIFLCVFFYLKAESISLTDRNAKQPISFFKCLLSIS